jgi:hypothetical protein
MIDRRSFLLLSVHVVKFIHDIGNDGQKDTLNRHTQGPGFLPPPVR